MCWDVVGLRLLLPLWGDAVFLARKRQRNLSFACGIFGLGNRPRSVLTGWHRASHEHSGLIVDGDAISSIKNELGLRLRPMFIRRCGAFDVADAERWARSLLLFCNWDVAAGGTSRSWVELATFYLLSSPAGFLSLRIETTRSSPQFSNCDSGRDGRMVEGDADWWFAGKEQMTCITWAAF